MIADLQPYSSYKDSEVEWLGDVPKHWEVQRLKNIFQRIIGGTTPSSNQPDYWDGDVVWITPTDVSKNAQLFTSLRKITREGLKATSLELVPPGSLVITSRAPVGNVAVAQVELCTNQGCKTLIPNNDFITTKYGFNLLKTLKSEIQSLASGTTFTEISRTKLGDIFIPLPPLPEQTAIVRYLDYMDRRIRRLNSAKKKLIALLEEEKQAIIHNAVTRGLDPNVRLKPSGVEWLGDVPEHWVVSPVKRHFDIRLGKMLQNSPNDKNDIEVSYLKAQHIQWFRVLTTNAPKMWANPREIVQYQIANGDLLVCEGGEGGRCGIVKDLECHFIIQNALHRVRAHLNSRNDFMQYLMITISTLKWFDAINNKATIAHFTREKFGSLRIPIPPLPEQTAIVNYLDQTLEKIDSTITHTQRQITLLQEYRTRLIADVITGKLDVREAAAHLPEESGESEASELLDELDCMGDDEASANELGFEEETGGTGEWPVE